MTKLSQLKEAANVMIKSFDLGKEARLDLMRLGIRENKVIRFIKIIGRRFVLVSVGNGKLAIPFNLASYMFVVVV